MRFFFLSKQFKIIVCIAVALIAISIFCMVWGNRIAPQSDILGTITAPFKSIATFTENTFVGDPMDNAVMILDLQKVIKYWQLCE